MNEQSKLPYLRLIGSDELEAAVSKSGVTKKEYRSQVSLFSESGVDTLGFVEASSMSAPTFLKMLEDVGPKYVLDLRQVPNFSNGKLTRRLVFAMFKELSIEYFDIAGYLGLKSPRDTSLNPKLLIPNIMENVLRKESISGPVLFFVDDDFLSESYINEISKTLPNPSGKGWHVSLWQNSVDSEKNDNSRNIVFISHANPEDNDVALWFATRLAAEGYNVWSDVTRLVGGEVFWDSIEEVIRNKTVKFIVLLSKDGHLKNGVLDEVNLAVSTERQLNLENFVIPVRIDDLSFSDIRANLARKNVIDGSAELKSALLEVIDLLEDSGVERNSAVNDREIKLLCKDEYLEEESDQKSQWSTLYQNKIEIKSLPNVIRKFRGPKPPFHFRKSDEFASIASTQGGVLSFASFEEVSKLLNQTAGIAVEGETLSEGIFSGEAAEFLHAGVGDIKRSVSALIRNSWNETCRSKGLIQYLLSSNRVCWFYKLGHLESDKVVFKDHAGKKRKKTLVGRSNKRNVYWHFAIEAQIQINDRSIRLKPHVVFSEDGIEPFQSAAKQHSLRRGFCRSWWNDRWRDLLDAMLQSLADGQDEWQLISSTSQKISLSGVLERFDVEDGKFADDTIGILAEPKVEVGFNQHFTDARKGLMLFGPLDYEHNPSEIRLGVIGTKDGINLFNRWCNEFRKPCQLIEKQILKGEVPFPGFEAVFGAKWGKKAKATIALSKTDLINSIRIKDRHQAVYDAVDLYVSGIIKKRTEDDTQVDIWFVVIPDDVYQYGRPNSRVPAAVSLEPKVFMNKKTARKFSSETPSLFEADNTAAKIYQHHADFHHQLKARLLNEKIVTQIFRESSITSSLDSSYVDLEDEEEELTEDVSMSKIRRMQAPSNVAWNLSTASFFKSGGRPWKVSTARLGVCYLGLIFKKDEYGISGNACCGAQLFLDSGEGVVFKGSLGPWYSNETKQYHLSSMEAEKLMSKALLAYKETHSIYPSEIFVHGRTRFNDEELAGFSAACEGKSEVTGVRITRTSDFKLYSIGELPVKRGTYQRLTERVGLLWTSGYVSELGTYPGRETPNPLRVEICGETSSNIVTVLNDIMTLTKMNFNSSVYSDGYPVTMRFADAIGDVLMASHDKSIPPLPFRHYI